MLSPLAARYAADFSHVGRIADATHVGRGGTRGDGPYVWLWLKLNGSIVEKVGYECNGCPSSMAIGGAISALSEGRPLELLRKLSAAELLQILGGLPEGKEYYAELATDAIQNVLSLSESHE